MAADESPATHEQPVHTRSTRARVLARVFILSFLAFQIGMPLTYYLGGRGYDERFSWRMFSSVRLQECDVQVSEQLADGRDRAVALGEDLQVAWVNILKRLRPVVVAKYLARRCAASAADGVSQVVLVGKCFDAADHGLPEQRFALSCDTAELSSPEQQP